PYNYVPTQWICVTFVALFSINTVLHFYRSFKFRMWWLIPTAVVAGFLEILGWSARLWSSVSPRLLTPFELQWVVTILAPTPFLAANFLILGKIIIRLGLQYSRLLPRLYALIFCTLDVICLIIQAAGGVIAVNKVNQNQNPDKVCVLTLSMLQGCNIVLAGVTVQSCVMALYVFCAGEFLLHFLNDTPICKISAPASEEKRCTKVMEWNLVLGLVIQTFYLFVRSTYRTIEFSNGCSGPITSTQAYVNVFDGLMMTIAMCTLNLIHPGFFLAETPQVTESVDWPRHYSACMSCATSSG
ncbi:RTA1 like protein-domain-containing protein, partial [Pisolithus marmoratus]